MTRRNNFVEALLAGCLFGAALVSVATPVGYAQDNKSTDVSKVVRLNRAPVNKEVLRVQLPRPTVVKLPNGITLVLLEDHKLPTVSFTMMIRPGQLADPDDLPGWRRLLRGCYAKARRRGQARRLRPRLIRSARRLARTPGSARDICP
jgi:hypothetical protein